MLLRFLSYPLICQWRTHGGGRRDKSTNGYFGTTSGTLRRIQKGDRAHESGGSDNDG